MSDLSPSYLNDRLLDDLIRRYHFDVERAVHRCVPTGCGSQDVTWITWELAARKLVRFQIAGSLPGTFVLALGDKETRSWLVRTATFCARNHARAQWRLRRRLETIGKVTRLGADTVDFAVKRDTDLRVRCVLTAIGELTPELRPCAGR